MSLGPGDVPRKQPVQAGSTETRFSILVCTDGTEESYRGLRYAVRVGSGQDADLTLLYVRQVDQGLRTGGLDLSVARRNMLDWGLELPGMTALRKGRDILVELGYLSEKWQQEFRQIAVADDPLGDHSTVYVSEEGRRITLKLMVSPSVPYGILDEAEAGRYDLVIISRPDSHDSVGLGYIAPDTADMVAIEHSGTVLVAQGLEESHGHLVCVTDSPESIAAARRDAIIASRCACPVYLFSVAADESELADCGKAVAAARAAIEEVGIKVSGEKVVVGDPVESIVEEGRNYSVTVLSAARRRTGWRRFFTTSVAYKVLEHAKSSVMIAR